MTHEMLSDRYRIEGRLGAGGMGTVYLGYDTRLERRVAIKMLPADIEPDPQARARFRREALAAAALDHPFICKIFEVGEHQGRGFLVMEHIEGQTLEPVIVERRLTSKQVLGVAHELAQALGEAHRRGIIHRDLKPSNIMLTAHGHVKVLDFGLAKQSEGVANGGAGWEGKGLTTATPDPGDGMTRPGIRLGTPSYMSPEQVLGSPLDARSDVFSLGVVLHELACGRHPFRQETLAGTMAAILRDPLTLTEGELDVVPGFGRIVRRMLAKAAAERFQTMADVAGEIEALRDRGTAAVSGAHADAAAAPSAERTTFVARESELGDLVAHLDDMLLGRGGLVLTGGEPGVGKTRLARELQRLARARGCVTLTGHCYEQEGAPPFGPFVETIEQAALAYPAGARAAMGDVAPYLAAMAPELCRQFPDIPPLPPAPADQQRRLLFNGYLTYLQRATARSAAVVLLDDLHWADDATVQLLQHVAPHLRAMRLLVVGTYRDVDLDSRRPFARALETVVRQRQATRIVVRRLGAAGVEQLLEAMSGAAPPAPLVAAIYAETEGNPFFVEEVFQHLKEEGHLFDDAGAWNPQLRVEDIDVPEGVRLVISRRLERLGDEARKLLAAAAVIGRSFPLDLLLAVAEHPEDAILDAIEAAQRAQLLQEERGREARYSFVHELIRSTALADLSLPRRQRLHLRIAGAIERRRGPALDAYVSALAHHLYQAGAAADPERAIAAMLNAMRRAHASGAFEEALTIGEQLDSYDLQPDSDEDLLRAELRADALWALGRLESACDIAGRLLDAAIRRGNARLIDWAAFLMGNAFLWGGREDLALATSQKALAALPADAEAYRISLLSRSSYGLWGLGRMREADATAREAATLAMRIGDNQSLASARSTQLFIASSTGRFAEAVRLSDEVLGLAGRAEGGLSVHGTAYIMKAIALPALGRDREFEALLRELEPHRGRSLPLTMMVSRFELASLVLANDGNLQKARAEFDGIIREAGAGARGGYDAGAAGLDLYLGRTADAIAGARQAANRSFATQQLQRRSTLFAVLAWSGAVAEARELWQSMKDDLLAARVGDLERWRGVWAAWCCATALPLIDESHFAVRCIRCCRN